MAAKQSPASLIVLTVIGVAVIGGVFFYVRNEQQQLDDFDARQKQKFANYQSSGPRKRIGNKPTVAADSFTRLKLTALRAKIARDKAASPIGKPIDRTGMSADEVEKIKGLRRQLSRSFAGRYTREQVHLIVPAIKEMLRGGRSPALLSEDNGNTPANLSWRVHLLPFIGERELYERFKLDEPWDSAHNNALLSEMPMLYRGLYDKENATVTRLQAVEMLDSFSSGGKLRSIAELTDPAADTIGLIIVGTKLAVPWTKPEDFRTTPEQFADHMKLMPKPTYWVGTIEGAAINVRFDGQYKTLADMVTMTGGESNALDAMQKEKARLMRADR